LFTYSVFSSGLSMMPFGRSMPSATFVTFPAGDT